MCASFVDSVQPGGFMSELYDLGDLAVIIGNTLFLHGGLIGDYRPPNALSKFDAASRRACNADADDLDCLGFVPGREGRLTDVRQWVGELNGWMREQLSEWRAQPHWEGPCPTAYVNGARGGHALMDYVVVGSEPSVVMGRHVANDNMPKPMAPRLVDALNAQGITRLVVGHTPHGNCPTVMKTASTTGGAGLEVVMADTSYSDMQAADNRGRAVSDVRLKAGGQMEVGGCLHDGAAIHYELARPIGPPSELIGLFEPPCEPPSGAGRGAAAPCAERGSETVAEERRFVKARYADSDYLLCSVNGFQITYEKVDATSVEALFGLDSEHPEARETAASLTREIRATKGKPTAMRIGTGLGSFGDEMVQYFFNLADVDRSGLISVEELRTVIATSEQRDAFLKLLIGTGRQPITAEMLLARMDTDRTGKISLAEFREQVRAGHGGGGARPRVRSSLFSPLETIKRVSPIGQINSALSRLSGVRSTPRQTRATEASQADPLAA